MAGKKREIPGRAAPFALHISRRNDVGRTYVSAALVLTSGALVSCLSGVVPPDRSPVPPSAVVAPIHLSQRKDAPHTIYIVGSAEDADRVLVALSEADSIRAASGEQPMFDEVVVADSDEVAEAILQLHAELNYLLAPHQPEVVVKGIR